MSDRGTPTPRTGCPKEYAHIPCWKYADLFEYHRGVGGEGAHAFAWSDKPHRLVYDLTRLCVKARDEAADLREQLKTVADNIGCGPDRIVEYSKWVGKTLLLIDGLREQLAEARAALQRLVDLKAMKEEIETNGPDAWRYRDYYEQNKEAAWQQAREALAAPQQSEQNAERRASPSVASGDSPQGASESATSAPDSVEVPEGCTVADAQVLRKANHELAETEYRLRQALRFYANEYHFNLSDPDAWDSVSGETPNFWCDEASPRWNR